MTPGNSVHHDANPACRPEPDDASRSGATAGDSIADYGGGPARPLRSHKTLQDIQDIIDELAAVTQQLRRPGRGVPSSLG